MILQKLLLTTLTFIVMATGCGLQNEQAGHTTIADTSANELQVPAFHADSAYQYVAKQVGFGPRIPGTAAQKNCAAWLQQQLNSFCDTVYLQETTLTAGDKKTQLPCINLIGSINPSAQRRVLLLAHWDSRPWADQDPQHTNKGVDGADDGASGVGVLLEIARTLKNTPLQNKDIGVDILFVDVEDYGKSEWGEDSYALGTQYWAHNPHLPGYRAQAGILLDMVGGANARFAMEAYSKKYASQVLNEVWAAASRAGYSSYFVYENGGGITDDHVPVNEILHIPTIDIINLPAGSATGFVAHWHTGNDNMTNIDKNTLKAVGQTILQYLFEQ